MHRKRSAIALDIGNQQDNGSRLGSIGMAFSNEPSRAASRRSRTPSSQSLLPAIHPFQVDTLLRPFLIRQRVSLSTLDHLFKISSAARSVSGHIIVQMNEASQEYEQDDGGLDSYERERHISALRESHSSLRGLLANRVQ